MIPFISELPEQEQFKWIKALNQLLPSEDIVHIKDVPASKYVDCELAIVANPDVTVLSQFQNIKWVHSLWAGVEKLMVSLADSPIEVVRLIDPTLSQTMAEAVLTWSLYLHREIPEYAKQQREKKWFQHDYIPAEQRTIGILGLGELGQVSAAKLAAHGFNVMGWSRTYKPLSNINTFSGKGGLSSMVQQCDIVICLLPLTPETKNVVSKKLVLAAMPNNSAIINFSRGGVINTEDLIEALDNRSIKHAVLDVFDQEPLSKNSNLWHHPHVSVLPHISAPTNLNSACEIVVNNIISFRETGILPKCVDKVNGY